MEVVSIPLRYKESSLDLRVQKKFLLLFKFSLGKIYTLCFLHHMLSEEQKVSEVDKGMNEHMKI
mgnify:CR=1 FL=1